MRYPARAKLEDIYSVVKRAQQIVIDDSIVTRLQGDGAESTKSLTGIPVDFKHSTLSAAALPMPSSVSNDPKKLRHVHLWRS